MSYVKIISYLTVIVGAIIGCGTDFENGRRVYDEGKFDAAIELLEKVTEEDVGFMDSQDMLYKSYSQSGHNYLTQGDTSSAINQIEKGVSIGDKYPDIVENNRETHLNIKITKAKIYLVNTWVERRSLGFEGGDIFEYWHRPDIPLFTFHSNGDFTKYSDVLWDGNVKLDYTSPPEYEYPSQLAYDILLNAYNVDNTKSFLSNLNSSKNEWKTYIQKHDLSLDYLPFDGDFISGQYTIQEATDGNQINDISVILKYIKNKNKNSDEWNDEMEIEYVSRDSLALLDEDYRRSSYTILENRPNLDEVAKERMRVEEDREIKAICEKLSGKWLANWNGSLDSRVYLQCRAVITIDKDCSCEYTDYTTDSSWIKNDDRYWMKGNLVKNDNNEISFFWPTRDELLNDEKNEMPSPYVSYGPSHISDKSEFNGARYTYFVAHYELIAGNKNKLTFRRTR